MFSWVTNVKIHMRSSGLCSTFGSRYVSPVVRFLRFGGAAVVGKVSMKHQAPVTIIPEIVRTVLITVRRGMRVMRGGVEGDGVGGEGGEG